MVADRFSSLLFGASLVGCLLGSVAIRQRLAEIAGFAPPFVPALFGYLTGLSLFAYLSRRLNAVYGLMGFLFFILLPAVLRSIYGADEGLGVVFYSSASLLCLLRWREEKNARSWLLLAAFSAGFAAAAQASGLAAAGLSAFLFLIVSLQAPRRGWAGMVSDVLTFSAAGALPVLLHRAPGPDISFYTLSDGLAPLIKLATLDSESWQRLAPPLRYFFTGPLSPLLLLFLPWVFKGKWLEEKEFLLGFVLLYVVAAPYFTDPPAGFFLPVAPPLAALAVYGVFNAYLSVKRPAYLFATLFLFALLHGLYLWRFFAGGVLLG